jgi:hypothetical protein
MLRKHLAVKASAVDDFNQLAAERFSLADSTTEERAFLAICQAVWRQHDAAVNADNVPGEKLIHDLIIDTSWRPLKLSSVEEDMTDFGTNLEWREEAAAQYQADKEQDWRLTDRVLSSPRTSALAADL